MPRLRPDGDRYRHRMQIHEADLHDGLRLSGYSSVPEGTVRSHAVFFPALTD